MIKNKTILLTGANGGLGQAFIKALVALEPKKLYCAVRDTTTLNTLKDLDQSIEIVELDITNQDSIDALKLQIQDLDILINNAGTSRNQRLFDPEFTEIEINLKGTMKLTNAFLSKLQQKDAVVINISSILALVNLPMMAEYCISKSALHSFSQALRAELSAFGAEVFEVLPGPIDTRLTEGSPMPKTPASEIVDFVLEALERKEYEIYPDQFSQMIKQRLDTEPTKVVEEFAMSILAQ